MREVHPTARLDVGSGFVGECFDTDYLTISWRRVPMFGRNSINGSIEWLDVPNFLSTDGPPWTANTWAPHISGGNQESSTNPDWDSCSGENFDSVSIPWNRPVRVLPIYYWKVFQNTRSAVRCVRGNLLMENRM